MASPAITVAVQVNGTSTSAGIPLSRSPSPMSISSSTKRKRDDDGPPEADPRPVSTSNDIKSTAAINGSATRQPQNQTLLVHDLFKVLKSYDTEHRLLQRQLPAVVQNDTQPDAKRTKSGVESSPTTSLSIEDKITEGGYATLEDILADITRAANAQISELKSSPALHDGTRDLDNLVTAITKMKDIAHDLCRRESAYPGTKQLQSNEPKGEDAASQISSGRASLMTYATINNGKKPLLTSLQKPVDRGENGDLTRKQIVETGLPAGITVAHALGRSPVFDKPSRSRTLGELFPSPRNLPPLQPPKPNKGTTKSNVLTFYHPVLTDQSSYRTGTYFSQTVSTGQWLDYSNATPAAHKKTKQRERAQSLAGVKPSSTELEMSEMEALFRGAFSSFAPCKDDTAAVVSSGQLSRMYWQRYGRRNLERFIDSEGQPDEGEISETADAEPAPKNNLPDVDEDIIKEVIDTWDDSAVDPSLAQIMGQKSDEEEEVEDLLQEVSDLIETLASYQRNRNLTLPTSQDRSTADPPNGDMLRNGALSHQPTEEEMMTYEVLKAQLALIIKTLPPFAVARINSDRLEELSVSTKIEIRTDDFKGVMEEDERSRSVRPAAAQPSAPTQRSTPHRTPSMSGSMSFSGHHPFGGQYTANGRSPMPTPQHYPQTPARPQPPNVYQRPPSTVPLPQPHPAQVRHTPAPQQQYRAPNGYGGMTPQVAKPAQSYSQPNMPHYSSSGVAGQPRMQPHQGYPSMPQTASPNNRYPQPYTVGYPQQQQHSQQQHGQPSMHPPQHPGLPQHHQQRSYSPYVNGAGHIPQRAMSPQVAVQPHAYSQSPTPPQQHQQLSRPPYGTPNQALPINGRSYNVGPPGIPPQAHNRGGNVGATGYSTVMGDVQQKQVVEQARQQVHVQQQVQAQQQIQARLDAQSRASTFGLEASQVNKVAGLAGIGLGGNTDIQRMAAMRAASLGNGNSMSQSPRGPGPQPVPNAIPGAHGLNGGGALSPPVAGNVPPHGVNPSPTVSGSSPVA